MDDQNRNVSVRLDLEMIRELIAEEDPDVEVLELDESPGSGRGDNYTSMLYRLGVKGRRRSNSEPWEKSIIYKVLPDSKELRDAYKNELLFMNEVVFYTKVWPALMDLQSNGRRVFDGLAKVYIAKPDLIAMEDLKAKGFKMADRKKGLQVDKLKAVLKALAGFHALSLTLRESRPEVFARLSGSDATQSVQETLFRVENEDWYRQYYRTATSNALKMVSETLPADVKPSRSEILAKFKDFLGEDKFFRTMCELAAQQGPLTVFCHGDCWTNNFLFKEKTSHDSEAVCLVDFQLMRVGSLALDLAYLLYCCTTGQVRRVFMTQLLQHYHRHLMSALYVLDPAAEATRDPATMWSLLTEEMRRCGRFGLGLALDILPISTCTSDQAPDLYVAHKDDVPDEEGRALAPPPGGAECARLMTDLVVELVRNRAL
ncbi:uncharacterized protein LOC131668212 isoform X2 [Phymastichus coffea]|uniref:uncharacterized protein LOC131668212 isoform X2 n=1 Tax=Phymastichus coffea TaxID=108790 RepID=UPI00273CD590|nr:uncharacterized protein LOC131668212 isoform X2 [Phymastichus coffea]